MSLRHTVLLSDSKFLGCTMVTSCYRMMLVERTVLSALKTGQCIFCLHSCIKRRLPALKSHGHVTVHLWDVLRDLEAILTRSMTQIKHPRSSPTYLYNRPPSLLTYCQPLLGGWLCCDRIPSYDWVRSIFCWLFAVNSLALRARLSEWG